jgi:glycosyltransferase involved in cell wall biosynthesis
MALKKLSIIIPAYNEAATIHLISNKVIAVNLIDNIEKEIIIVNDCSKDATKEVIEKYIESGLLKGLIENKWQIAIILVASMFLKSIAAALTIGSGGNGGNFAPSLFVGAHLGFAFAFILQLLGFDSVPVVNFTLVAMAGVLSGVFHAPLTARTVPPLITVHRS